MASRLTIFFAELKRRKVYRVAAIYAAVGVILAVATAPQYVEGGGLRANARSDVGRSMAEDGFHIRLDRDAAYVRLAGVVVASGFLILALNGLHRPQNPDVEGAAKSGRRMANHPSMAPKTISGPVSLGGGGVARVSSSDGVGATSEVWEKGRGWVDGASPYIELLLGRGSGRQ